MLQLMNSLLGLSVLSLRTGGKVADVKALLVNPNNLKIEALYCHDAFSKNTLMLLPQDIREIMSQGIAVDDHDRLSEPSELIRLQNVIKINFNLIGKTVVTDTKRKLGKVSDFATDISSFMIQKLYVEQPVYKTISGGQLSIDRSQIVEINDSRIIVRDSSEKAAARSPLSAILGTSAP